VSYEVHLYSILDSSYASTLYMRKRRNKRLRKLGLGLKMLQLFVLDLYDLVLSKPTRNIGKDREDVKAFAQQHALRFSVVSKRYETLVAA